MQQQIPADMRQPSDREQVGRPAKTAKRDRGKEKYAAQLDQDATPVRREQCEDDVDDGGDDQPGREDDRRTAVRSCVRNVRQRKRGTEHDHQDQAARQHRAYDRTVIQSGQPRRSPCASAVSGGSDTEPPEELLFHFKAVEVG